MWKLARTVPVPDGERFLLLAESGDIRAVGTLCTLWRSVILSAIWKIHALIDHSCPGTRVIVSLGRRCRLDIGLLVSAPCGTDHNDERMMGMEQVDA